MSETSQTESNFIKTIKINDSVFLDVATNMVVIVVDRVTLTLTLQEYITLSSNIINSANYIQHYVSIKSSLSSFATKGAGLNLDSAQSGSTII